MGYCERKTDYEIERYVFKSGNMLEYSSESQSPYGRSRNEGSMTGEWRAAPGGVEYRFAVSDEWEPLQVETATHTCR